MKIIYGVIIDDALMIESDTREMLESEYTHYWEEIAHDDGTISAVFGPDLYYDHGGMSFEDLLKKVIDIKAHREPRIDKQINAFDDVWDLVPYELRESQEHRGPEIIIL